MSSKRKGALSLEDVKGLLELFDAAYAEFERYLPTKQDVAVYRRKRKGYQEQILAQLSAETGKEAEADGRDAGDGNE